MKKMAWEKHVSFRPELEVLVLVPVLTLDLLFPLDLPGFFALDPLRSPPFSFLFSRLLVLVFLFFLPFKCSFFRLPPSLLDLSAARISRPADSDRLFSSVSSAA